MITIQRTAAATADAVAAMRLIAADRSGELAEGFADATITTTTERPPS